MCTQEVWIVTLFHSVFYPQLEWKVGGSGPCKICDFVSLNGRYAMNVGVQVRCYQYRICTVPYISQIACPSISFSPLLSCSKSLGNRIKYTLLFVFLCVRNKRTFLPLFLVFPLLYLLFFSTLRRFLIFCLYTVILFIIYILSFLYTYPFLVTLI